MILSPLALIAQLLRFYSWLIILYIILSWFPMGGLVSDVRRVLGQLVEPYLSLFRRFIPPMGMLDISPIVAILVLNLIINALYRMQFSF